MAEDDHISSAQGNIHVQIIQDGNYLYILFRYCVYPLPEYCALQRNPNLLINLLHV